MVTNKHLLLNDNLFIKIFHWYNNPEYCCKMNTCSVKKQSPIRQQNMENFISMFFIFNRISFAPLSFYHHHFYPVYFLQYLSDFLLQNIEASSLRII